MRSRAFKNAAVVVATVGLVACTTSPKSEKTGGPAQPPPSAEPSPTAPHGNHIEISVTEAGFQPDKISVAKGEPVVLVFTRTTDKTCAKEVVVQTSDKDKVEKQLPLNQPVEVSVTFPTSGELKYACGMNMFSGVISVQ